MSPTYQVGQSHRHSLGRGAQAQFWIAQRRRWCSQRGWPGRRVQRGGHVLGRDAQKNGPQKQLPSMETCDNNLATYEYDEKESEDEVEDQGDAAQEEVEDPAQ